MKVDSKPYAIFFLSFIYLSVDYGVLGRRCRSVKLTEENFDILVTNKTNQRWLIKFFTTKCVHCKALAPVWIDLAIKGCDDKGLLVGEVDCNAESELKKRLNLDGYPSIYYVEEGKMAYKYKGARAVGNFLEFARGGYKKAEEREEIPPPLSFLQNIWRHVVKTWNVLLQSFQVIFNQVGLGGLSSPLKCFIVFFIFMSPMFCLLSCLFYLDRSNKQYIETEKHNRLIRHAKKNQLVTALSSICNEHQLLVNW